MEKDHLVTVEVHYIEQDIVGFNEGINGARCNKPTYRLFLDDELFSERSWIYSNNIYLLEHIRFKSSATNYTIRVEPVMYPTPEESYYDFELRNLTVNDVPADPNIPGRELHFTINSLV